MYELFEILFAILVVVLGCTPLLISSLITVRAVGKNKQVDEDAKFFTSLPEEFQRLISLETLRTVFLILGVIALILGPVVSFMGWLSRLSSAMIAGCILAVAALILLMVGFILSKRAGKLRTALRNQLSMPHPEKQSVLAQIPQEMEDSLLADTNIKLDQIQLYDVLLRK